MYDKLIELKTGVRRANLPCAPHKLMEEMGTKISNTEYFVLRYSSISPQGRTAQIRGCLLVLPRMGAKKASWKR